MSGTTFIMVGRKKTGKTTMTKKFLHKSNLPKVICDVNNEYKDFYNEDFVDFDVFLEKAKELENTYILFEEATIFFRSKDSAQDMINLLVRARHTKNVIQLNFHSFKSVPKDIYTLLDFVIIFKTNDVERDFKMKFDNKKIISTFLNAQKSKNPYYSKVIKLY